MMSLEIPVVARPRLLHFAVMGLAAGFMCFICILGFSYGLRALGVGAASRASQSTLRADVDSIKRELRAHVKP